MKICLLAFLMLFCTQSFASADIDLAAKRFYLNQVKAWDSPAITLFDHADHRCKPENQKRCITELCKHKNCRVYGEDVAAVCRGSDGECVAEICRHKNCQVYWREVAKFCVNSNGLCVRTVCNHISCNVWGAEVAEACNGADEECVAEICRHKNCQVYWKEVVKACGGK